MVVPQNRRKYKQANFEETQKSRTTPQRYHYPANQRADRTMGWMCENNEKRMIFLCKHPTFVLCLTCLRWRSEQVVCRKDWIKKTFLMGFLYTIFFLFSFIGLIHSVQLTQRIASNCSDYWLFSLFLHTFRLKKFGKCNAQKISPIFPPYREQVTGGWLYFQMVIKCLHPHGTFLPHFLRNMPVDIKCKLCRSMT